MEREPLSPRQAAALVLMAKARGERISWSAVLCLCAHALRVDLTDVGADREAAVWRALWSEESRNPDHAGRDDRSAPPDRNAANREGGGRRGGDSPAR